MNFVDTKRTATLKFYKSVPIHTSAIVRAGASINKGFSAQTWAQH